MTFYRIRGFNFKVTFFQGKRLQMLIKAKEYVEVSALTGENVNLLFQKAFHIAQTPKKKSNPFCKLV